MMAMHNNPIPAKPGTTMKGGGISSMPDEPIFVRYQATTRLPIPDIRQSSLTNIDERFHLISFASSMLSQYHLYGFQILLLYGVMTLAEQRSMKRIPGGTRRIA
jgi:hypothetical protein